MSDADLARLFTAAAEALEAASDEPLNSDAPNEYIRNDAFRTIARAFREVAPKPAEPEPTEVEYCRICGDDHTIETDEREMQGFCTARVHTDAGLVNWCALPLGHPEVHHFPDLCDSCAKPIREGIGRVRVPYLTKTGGGGVRTYHAECWDREQNR